MSSRYSTRSTDSRKRTALGDISNAGGAKKTGAKKASSDVRPTPPVAVSTTRSSFGGSKNIRASQPHVNIDAVDANDPQACSKYVNEIYAHFRNTEGCHGPTANYMSFQNDINEKMRSILFDWLVEVHLKFRLKTETLYLTFNLIDRFLERVQVSRSKLQLVGVTCLLLASKYEEIYPPEVRDLVYVTDKAYTKQQILRMEGMVIRSLEFRLTVPTHYKFLVRYIKAAQCDTRTKLIAYYFCEKCMPEFDMLEFKPSVIASAAVLLALKASDSSKNWTSTLEFYTKYTQDDITPCAKRIISIVQQAETASLQAIRKKYAQQKFGDAAGAAFRVKSL